MPRRRDPEPDAMPMASRAPIGNDNSLAGTVQRIVVDRGFCFIKDDEQGQDYFCHLSALQDCTLEELLPGQRVRFTPTDTPKGKRAESVWRA